MMEVVPTEKLSDVLAFIREWTEHGDIKEAAGKFKVEYSQACKMVRGEVKKPKVEFLQYLKEKALKNYNKLRI